ncbi:MAG: hypothetical protein DCC69_09600 [Hyphomicrobiales bacterium]|nr:MAG: hypothetical protein DCC69_09600 [Hyphomicrobiales bacterium]
MFFVIQDVLILLACLYYLMIFRFGFQQPWEIKAISKTENKVMFYTIVAIVYFLVFAVGRDLIQRIV